MSSCQVVALTVLFVTRIICVGTAKIMYSALTVVAICQDEQWSYTCVCWRLSAQLRLHTRTRPCPRGAKNTSLFFYWRSRYRPCPAARPTVCRPDPENPKECTLKFHNKASTVLSSLRFWVFYHPVRTWGRRRRYKSNQYHWRTSSVALRVTELASTLELSRKGLCTTTTRQVCTLYFQVSTPAWLYIYFHSPVAEQEKNVR